MNSEDIKLSVIVPIYNSEALLNKCVNSIIGQSYHNLEIILVNDGSDDQSLQICNNFQKIDPRIIVIDQKNMGVSYARKSGLNVASGEFITFVDSDDYIDLDMYRSLIEIANIEQCDIVESGFVLIGENGSILDNHTFNYTCNIGREKCLESFLLHKNSEVFLVNKVYRKELFNDFEFPNYKYSEDYLWNVILFSRCKKSITVSEPYYYYYKNMNSACNSSNYYNKIDGILAGIASLNFLSEFFPKLSYLGSIYIVNYTRFLFMIAYKSGYRNDKFFCQVSKYYRKYFNLHAIFKEKNFKRLFGYFLFFISPRIYASLNIMYHRFL